MARVRARAIVDPDYSKPRDKNGNQWYRVEVWGEEPHDYVRVYSLSSKIEDGAAQEGLRRFVQEMEELEAE